MRVTSIAFAIFSRYSTGAIIGVATAIHKKNNSNFWMSQKHIEDNVITLCDTVYNTTIIFSIISYGGCYAIDMYSKYNIPESIYTRLDQICNISGFMTGFSIGFYVTDKLLNMNIIDNAKNYSIIAR